MIDPDYPVEAYFQYKAILDRHERCVESSRDFMKFYKSCELTSHLILAIKAIIVIDSLWILYVAMRLKAAHNLILLLYLLTKSEVITQ